MRPESPLARWLLCAAVVVLCGSVYFFRLGSAPLYLGGDEAQFAVHAQSIASTGRDLNGRFLPVFVNITDPLAMSQRSGIWYQPLLFYLIAMVLKVQPLSELAARLPAAIIGMIDGLLMFAVARRLLGSVWYGVAAAAMLLLSPAHFIFGRQALDYVCPLPFVLGWLWCMVRFFETGRRRHLLAGALLLGVGMYSYVAAWAMMALFFAASVVVAWRSKAAGLATLAWSAAACGFPLVAAAFWLAWHPGVLSDTVGRYGLGGRLTAVGLIQRASLYWEYFDPAYLFLSGGTNPTQSTREAGLFLLPTVVFLVAGVYDCWRRRTERMRTLLLFGFAAAPLPIVITMPQSAHYAVGRELFVVPFGVLISTCGLAWLWRQPRASVRLAAVLLLVLLPIQFCGFLRGYYTTYQTSSGVRFDPVNMRGVADAVIAADAVQPVPVVFLSDGLDDGAVRWRFYAMKRQRDDLWRRTRLMNVDAGGPEQAPVGSLSVVSGDDARWTRWPGGQWAIATIVTDAIGSRAAIVLRKAR